jgi:hypothetical protein
MLRYGNAAIDAKLRRLPGIVHDHPGKSAAVPEQSMRFDSP